MVTPQFLENGSSGRGMTSKALKLQYPIFIKWNVTGIENLNAQFRQHIRILLISVFQSFS